MLAVDDAHLWDRQERNLIDLGLGVMLDDVASAGKLLTFLFVDSASNILHSDKVRHLVTFRFVVLVLVFMSPPSLP